MKKLRISQHKTGILLLLVAMFLCSASGCKSAQIPASPEITEATQESEAPTESTREVYTDEITGTYSAVYENVTITITADSDTGYYLTYSDGHHTLQDIPIAYFNVNTPTEKMLMFWLDDYYPEHGGYVEFCWSQSELSYNSLIEGLEDTYGYYGEIKKVETTDTKNASAE